eukprot:scaffold44717_cov65-Cyclotella_meneghiniana.AAC.4
MKSYITYAHHKPGDLSPSTLSPRLLPNPSPCHRRTETMIDPAACRREADDLFTDTRLNCQ